MYWYSNNKTKSYTNEFRCTSNNDEYYQCSSVWLCRQENLQSESSRSLTKLCYSKHLFQVCIAADTWCTGLHTAWLVLSGLAPWPTGRNRVTRPPDGVECRRSIEAVQHSQRTCSMPSHCQLTRVWLTSIYLSTYLQIYPHSCWTFPGSNSLDLTAMRLCEATHLWDRGQLILLPV